MQTKLRNESERIKMVVGREIILTNLLALAEGESLTLKDFRNLTGLKDRGIKEIIKNLRIELPIVARTVKGGGYWIAKDKESIEAYVKLLKTTIAGYEQNINVMLDHLISDAWKD